MAIVLTNGSHYITVSSTGKIGKTTNIEEAQIFYSCNVAMKKVFKAPRKCNGYYPYDTEDTEWNKPKKKQKRKKYSTEVRRMIYNNADGRCQLCGRKIMFSDATMDHVIPLALGGEDSVSNLQLACKVCNGAKDSYLPDDFQDRVFDTFCFQMEKKCGNNLKWKIAKNLLTHML